MVRSRAWFLRGGPPDVETYHNSLRVRQIANNVANGNGQASHESRYGENLVVSRQRRVLEEVNYLGVVFFRKIAGVDVPEVGDCGQRLGSLAGDVQTQFKEGRGSIPVAPSMLCWPRMSSRFISSPKKSYGSR